MVLYELTFRVSQCRRRPLKAASHVLIKLWKVWAALRRPKGIVRNSDRPEGNGGRLGDVLLSDRNLVARTHEVDPREDRTAGQLVGGVQARQGVCRGRRSCCDGNQRTGASPSFFTRCRGAAHWLLEGRMIPNCIMWSNSALALRHLSGASGRQREWAGGRGSRCGAGPRAVVGWPG